MTEQRKQIEAARKLLKPSKVTPYKIPTWLSERLIGFKKTRTIRLWGDDDLREVTSYIGEREGLKLPCWLDHWGTTTNGGPYRCCQQECFVSEPYGPGLKVAQLMDEVCKVLDLTWHFVPNSWWFPGRTTRIVIHPPMRSDT